jgi:hypothetical protein
VARTYVREPDETFLVHVFSADLPQTLGVQRAVAHYITRYQLGTCPPSEAGCRTTWIQVGPNDTRPARILRAPWLYYDDVTSRPEAHLYFPGSSLMGSYGSGQGAGHLVGFDDPWVRADLITPTARKEEVTVWYRKELAARGYRLVRTESSGPTEYRRGSERFRLFVPTFDSSLRPYRVPGLRYTTEYEIDTCAGHHPPTCRV